MGEYPQELRVVRQTRRCGQPSAPERLQRPRRCAGRTIKCLDDNELECRGKEPRTKRIYLRRDGPIRIVGLVMGSRVVVAAHRDQRSALSEPTPPPPHPATAHLPHGNSTAHTPHRSYHCIHEDDLLCPPFHFRLVDTSDYLPPPTSRGRPSSELVERRCEQTPMA